MADKKQAVPNQESAALVEEKAQSSVAPQMKLGSDLNVVFESMTPAQRIQFLSKVSEYVGAETMDINNVLNTPIKVCGVLIHMGTARQKAKMDLETGEIIPEQLVDAPRTVFKSENDKVYAFMATSVQKYVESFLIPAFGIGNWIDDEGNPIWVTLIIRQKQGGQGRVYTVQVIG